MSFRKLPFEIAAQARTTLVRTSRRWYVLGGPEKQKEVDGTADYCNYATKLT